jgi:hypothetical protein
VQPVGIDRVTQLDVEGARAEEKSKRRRYIDFLLPFQRLAEVEFYGNSRAVGDEDSCRRHFEDGMEARYVAFLLPRHEETRTAILTPAGEEDERLRLSRALPADLDRTGGLDFEQREGVFEDLQSKHVGHCRLDARHDNRMNP